MPNMVLDTKSDKNYTILLKANGQPTGYKTCNRCNRVLLLDHECGLHDDEKVTKATQDEHAAALQQFVNPPAGIKPPGWRNAQGISGTADVEPGMAAPMAESVPVLHNEDMPEATVAALTEVQGGETTDTSTPHRRSRRDND